MAPVKQAVKREIKPKLPLHKDVTFKKGKNNKGLMGGAIAMFPKLADKTWQNILDHLMEYHPNNKQGIRKAMKMLNRA